jgi:hypothetical protein
MTLLINVYAQLISANNYTNSQKYMACMNLVIVSVCFTR